MDNIQVHGSIGTGGGHVFMGNTNFKGETINFYSPKDKFTCLHHLRETDPVSDIDRFRCDSHKGTPLVGSFEWVLQSQAFEAWDSGAAVSNILWIRGDPGKGKTMIMIGLIDKLSRRSLKRNDEGQVVNSAPTVSHFFCESHDKFHNNAVSILRGLLYMLLSRRPELLLHLEEALRTAGPRLFEDSDHNLIQSLKRIFLETIQDESLGSALFFVDGLDECEKDVDSLIDLILQSSSTGASKVQWIITSRKNENFIKKLDSKCHNIDLEQNQAHVKEAVRNYIDLKMGSLDYSESTKIEVSEYLKRNSGDTFLWVHLVFKMLVEDDVSEWDVLLTLEQVPPGLDALYERMFQKISLNKRDNNLGYQVLGIAITAYRPMRLAEMVHVLQLPKSLESFLRQKTQESASEYLVEQLEKIVGKCASFLSVREKSVHIVHKSAQDFLWEYKSPILFSNGKGLFHLQLGNKCLELLSKNLRRDILDFQTPGALMKHWEARGRNTSTKAKNHILKLEYAATFWVNHRMEAVSDEKVDALPAKIREENSDIDQFLREHILHWIELLSVLRILPTIFLKLNALEIFINGLPESNEQSMISTVLEETGSFLRRRFELIESTPLQIYMVLPLFDSDSYKLLRQSITSSAGYPWITIVSPSSKPESDDCLLVLEREGAVTDASFSSPEKLATCGPGQIRVWDTKRGICEDDFSINPLQGDPISVTLIDNDKKVFGLNKCGVAFIGTCQNIDQKVTTYECLRGIAPESEHWEIRLPKIQYRTDDSQVVVFNTTSAYLWTIAPGEASASPLDTGFVRDFNECDIRDIFFSTHTEYIVVCSRYSQTGIGVLEIWNSKTRGCVVLKDTVHTKRQMKDVQLISNSCSTYLVYKINLNIGPYIRILDINGEVPIDIGIIDSLSWRGGEKFEMFHNTDMFAASQDGIINIWKIGIERPVHSFHAHEIIGDFKVSPDDRLLASYPKYSNQGTVKLWDLDKAIRKYPKTNFLADAEPNFPLHYTTKNARPKQDVFYLTVSACGTFAACVRYHYNELAIEIYHTKTGDLKTIGLLQSTVITSMEFVKVGETAGPFLVAISQDLYLRWWDPLDPETGFGKLELHLFRYAFDKTIDLCPRTWEPNLVRPIVQPSDDFEFLGCVIGGVRISANQTPVCAQQAEDSQDIAFTRSENLSLFSKKWPITIELYRIQLEEKMISPIAFVRHYSTEFEHTSPARPLVNAIKFSTDNRWLAIIFMVQDFLLLNIESGAFTNFGHLKFGTVSAADFYPDSDKVVLLHSQPGKLGITAASILDCHSGTLLNKIDFNIPSITNHTGLISRSRVPLSIITMEGTTWARTDCIMIPISLASDETATEQKPAARKPEISFQFILNYSWLAYRGERILWIPHDFRPNNTQDWIIKDDMVVVLSRLGMVYTIRFYLDSMKRSLGIKAP